MINIARKKPVEVEVCQWTGENVDEIKDFCGYGGIGRHARFRFWCRKA